MQGDPLAPDSHAVTTTGTEAGNFDRDAAWNAAADRLAYLVITIFFIPVTVLILRDRRVWPWDEAFYAEYSVWLFRTLIHSPQNWPSAMVHALGDRAPAISWLGQFFVPLGHALPFLQTALLFSVLATQAITIFLLYRVLRHVFASALAAIVTCCIAASGSLFVGLTYRYFVEPLQLLSVMWVFALGAFHERFTRPVLWAQLIAAFSFGLLVKTSTPLFQFPIALYVVYLLVCRKRPRSQPGVWDGNGFLAVVILGTALIALGTAAWYFVNFQATLRHVVEASSGHLALYYGSRGSLLTKLHFWTSQAQKSFLYWPLLMVIALMLPGAFAARYKRRHAFTQADVLALLSGVWIVLVLLLFSRNINEDTRYLLGLLPYMACAVCWVASNCRPHFLLVALGAASILQLGVVSAQSYGLISPLPGLNSWLQAYVKDPTALEDSMFCAAHTADVTVAHPGIAGVELPEFNEVGLSFYSVILGHGVEPGRWFYNGFDWTEADPATAWRKVDEIGARYYLYRKHDPSLDSDPINHLSALEFNRVTSSSEFRFRADKSNERVLVYERISVPGLDTPQQSSADLYQITYHGFQGVNPELQLPFGLLERPLTGSTQTGSILPVFGWAVSPAGIASIELSLDGMHPTDASKNSRPDVQKAYPNLPSTGFTGQLDLSSIPDGSHRLSVKVYSLDGAARIIADIAILNHSDYAGANPEGRAPFGLLDYPKSADLVNSRDPLPFAGWAIAQSALERVDVLLDGRHIARAAWASRPDVTKAYPGRNSSGFTAAVPLKAIPKGPHRFSVLAKDREGAARVIAQVTLVR